MDKIVQYRCNACAETEGGYRPCFVTMWLDTIKPEMCPENGDECEWEKVNEPESPKEDSIASRAQGLILTPNETENPWTNVNEPPKQDGVYLVRQGYLQPFVVLRNDIRWYDESQTYYDITHYMPIPELPKDERWDGTENKGDENE